VHLHDTSLLLCKSSRTTRISLYIMRNTLAALRQLGRRCNYDLADGISSDFHRVMMSARRNGIHLDALHPSCRPVHQQSHTTDRQISKSLLPLPQLLSLANQEPESRSRLLLHVCCPMSLPLPYTRSASRNRAGPRVCYSALTAMDVGQMWACLVEK
jgi:hypothetical protein